MGGENTKPQVDYKEQYIQSYLNTYYKSDNFYMFGVDALKQKKLLAFNTISKQISEIPPPENMPIYNMMATCIVGDKIYISGGYDNETDTAQRQCGIYYPKTNKYQPLLQLKTSRFLHNMIIYDQKLYIMGGRGEKVDKKGAYTILKSCERYDLLKQDIDNMADMKNTRCGFTTCIFKGKIYAFGGQTGDNNQKTKKIDKYNPSKNKWENLGFKLKEGFDGASFATSNEDHEFYLLGGIDTEQKTMNKIMKYNFNNSNDKDKHSKVQEKTLVQDKAYHKQFINSIGEIYLLGGNQAPICEYFDLKDLSKAITHFPLQMPQNVLQNFQQFTGANVVNYIKGGDESKFHEQEIEDYKQNQLLPKFYYFKIKENNKNQEKMVTRLSLRDNKFKTVKCPQELEHNSYMGTLQLNNQGHVLLVGGHSDLFNKTSNGAQIYDFKNNKVEKLESMRDARYKFSILQHEHFIYVLGGRQSDVNGDKILNTCERYNLIEKNWESIGNMNQPRQGAIAFSLQGKICVGGGLIAEKQRDTGFEIYNEQTNQWELMGIQLPIGLEGSQILHFQNDVINQLLVIGGLSAKGELKQFWSYDLSQGFDACFPNEIGSMEVPRAYHQVFDMKADNQFIIFGNDPDNKGEHIVQCMKFDNGTRLVKHDFANGHYGQNFTKYMKKQGSSEKFQLHQQQFIV